MQHPKCKPNTDNGLPLAVAILRAAARRLEDSATVVARHLPRGRDHVRRLAAGARDGSGRAVLSVRGRKPRATNDPAMLG